jgi:hypothetical protein
MRLKLQKSGRKRAIEPIRCTWLLGLVCQRRNLRAGNRGGSGAGHDSIGTERPRTPALEQRVCRGSTLLEYPGPLS